MNTREVWYMRHRAERIKARVARLDGIRRQREYLRHLKARKRAMMEMNLRVMESIAS